MPIKKYPAEFIKLLQSITAKRPKTVIDHILKHGHITTEDLQKLYGYEHPPRAARDVREQGIPLETFRVKNKDGRSIAAYRFADPRKISKSKWGGRQIFSKKFRNSLIEMSGPICSLCCEKYNELYLQIDHRVPYEISGDVPPQDRTLDDYMLLCGACNRAKSWSCEHCGNRTDKRSASICGSCYWAFPNEYKHVALQLIRRVDIVWSGDEIQLFERINSLAQINNQRVPSYVKTIIERFIKEN